MALDVSHVDELTLGRQGGCTVSVVDGTTTCLRGGSKQVEGLHF